MDSFGFLIVLGALAGCGVAGAATAAETVLAVSRRSKMSRLAEEWGQDQTRILTLLDRRDEVIGPLQLARLSGQVAAVSGVAGFVSRLVNGSSSAPAVMATLLSIPVVHLLSSTIPRTWALRRPSSAWAFAPRAVGFATRIPLLTFGSLVSRRVAGRLIPVDETVGNSGGEGADHAASLGDTESLPAFDDELLMEQVEVFERTIAREIMIPRRDMVTLAAADSVAVGVRLADDHGFSRFPVTGPGGIDDVVGVVYTKDLAQAMIEGSPFTLVEKLAVAAKFVPSTKRVPVLLREMQKDKVHLAVVVDEYGGTAGLVTLEDILEELVGEIVDEFDEEELPQIRQEGASRWWMSASLLVEEANQSLPTALPLGDYRTVGGLLFDVLGRVPIAGERIDVAGTHITVGTVEDRRINDVTVEAVASEEVT